MNLKEQIQEDARIALKENDTLKKNLLRTLIAELDRKTKNPTNQEIYSVMKKMVDNAKLIGGDDSLKEIEILNTYIPAPLTEAEMTIIVSKTIEENPTEKNKNKLVGLTIRKCEGRGNPQFISKIINEL